MTHDGKSGPDHDKAFARDSNRYYNSRIIDMTSAQSRAVSGDRRKPSKRVRSTDNFQPASRRAEKYFHEHRNNA
jgi:hypothetical protein